MTTAQIYKINLISFSAKQVNTNANLLFVKYKARGLAQDLLENYLSKKTESNTESNFETYFILGRINFVNGNLDASIKYFDLALSVKPDHLESWYGKGLSYGYKNQLENAKVSFIKFFEIIESMKNDKNYTEHRGLWAAYNDLAWIYFSKGEIDMSEKIVDEALRKYSNPWLYNIKGTILLHKKQNKLAEDFFLAAESYTKTMSVSEFGQAYSADNYLWHVKGFNNMKKIINDNLEISKQN